jgi:predicted MPP superfamily phosphohydrolase
LADIFRLGNYFFHFFPGIISDNPAQTKFFTLLAVVSITGLLLIYGYVNAGIFRIKKLDIEISARKSSLQELNIVMLSDLHLGTIIGKRKLKTIVEKVNSLNPDIVILAGDVVDENIAPVMKLNLGEMLSDIKSTYGTYAITGNHEFI